ARASVRAGAGGLPHLAYADGRLEITEAKSATAENGGAKSSSDDYAFGLGVRVLAGDRALAPGYLGLTLGAADVDDLPRVIREALERAYRRPLVNAQLKAEPPEKVRPL